ncbi:major facilitator superfamily domain-containing protein [Naematelia encephala]|uniref:Major facilitator superfamily domain-containing protein n=1 Tax=Naematelia encephala TaxID=71784 RepID=A0A1Y2BB27_9TREE|nr:major facilitator superfamily domain-containing protein [Naematelia encephala]
MSSEKLEDTVTQIHESATIATLEQPAYQLDDVQYKKLIRKIDRRLVPCLALLYLISYVDRSSLANASILGLKKSLNIDGKGYNLIVTSFFFSYSVFEIPSQIVINYVRPSLWLAILTAVWGMITTLSGLAQNFGGAFAARFCLGIVEAGFFPAAMLQVALWYPREELQKRVGAFYATGVLAGSFSGLIAYGITHMDGDAGLESWRWLFILEGIATVALASVVLVFMPDSPERAKWLTTDEKEQVIAARTYSGAGAQESQEWTMHHLKEAATDVKVWLYVWLSICINISSIGFSYTLPTVLLQLGYSAANAQLMTVPIYAVAALCVVTAAYFSDRIQQRSFGCLCGFTVGLIGLVVLYCMPKDSLSGVRYFFCMWVLGGLFAIYPSILSWNSNNNAGRGKKNMAVTLQLAIGNLSTAAGNNSYLASEAPNYKTGFGLGIALCASGILVTLLLSYILRKENARKALVDVS